jgi:catechol 2,3-dioxygenase-like lactoylglutathione lyase family enzyme
VTGVRGIGHVAIGVRDLDRALAFYRDVIGLRVSAVEHETVPARPTAPAVDRRAAYLHCTDDPLTGFLVLDEQPAPFGGEPRELFELGIHHYAFWVESVDAVVDRATRHGVAAAYGPLDLDSDRYGEPSGSRLRMVMLRDPDGNLVQCDERQSDE